MRRVLTRGPLLVLAGALVAGLTLAAPAVADPVRPKPVKPGSEDDAAVVRRVLAFEPFTSTGVLAGTGWAECTDPVVWSVDTTNLDRRSSKKVLDALDVSFRVWSGLSGLRFARGEDTALNFVDDTSIVVPRDGEAQRRHIYIDFVPDADSKLLSGGVVGLAAPNQYDLTNREIIGGWAAFRSDYVNTATYANNRALFLHELGHVLGLAHSSDAHNSMYALLHGADLPGSGDVLGLWTLLRPCVNGTPNELSQYFPLPPVK